MNFARGELNHVVWTLKMAVLSQDSELEMACINFLLKETETPQ
jgi:hypothetical protein